MKKFNQSFIVFLLLILIGLATINLYYVSSLYMIQIDNMEYEQNKSLDRPEVYVISD